MLEGLTLAIGGLGLFLLGMAVMTDGLRAMADDRLRSLLARSTRSPISGAVTGAITTALVQSSSATTVAAVGFVGAGLMTFPQALGIIFGANIGTTITGWLVALVGFKLKLGNILLPLVLVGVMFRLFGGERKRGFGNALAGFGLIFVGIATLQDGMGAFSGIVTPESFPPDTFVGRLLLLLIGLVITVVTQSSSAGVAMALTAVSVGSITLAQASAMVIGMDIGTTITALVATIGGSVQARRTGLAHVVYNVMTGLAAFCLLTPYLNTVEYCFPDIANSDPELALVGFHTTFNFVGVLAVLPLTGKFASLITKLIPDRGDPLVQRLDEKLLGTPDLAMAAVEVTVRETTNKVFRRLAAMLRGEIDSVNASELERIDTAIRTTQRYLNSVHIVPERESLFDKRLASIHILDHLRRLTTRLGEIERIESIRSMTGWQNEVTRLADTAVAVADQPESMDDARFLRMRRDYQRLKQLEKQVRREQIASAARGEYDAKAAVAATDAVRGLKRIGYHVWRISRQIRQSADNGQGEFADNNTLR